MLVQQEEINQRKQGRLQQIDKLRFQIAELQHRVDKDEKLQKKNKVTLQTITEEAQADKGRLERMLANSKEWESSILRAEASIALAESNWRNFSSKFEL